VPRPGYARRGLSWLLFTGRFVLFLRNGARDPPRDGKLIVNHDIEAAALAVRPDCADLAPVGFRFFAFLGLALIYDIGDVGWLAHVLLLRVVKPPEWWLRWRFAKTGRAAFILVVTKSNGVFVARNAVCFFEGLNALRLGLF
jgi:hypothetical protein